jgi:hypothetical protein
MTSHEDEYISLRAYPIKSISINSNEAQLLSALEHWAKSLKVCESFNADFFQAI